MYLINKKQDRSIVWLGLHYVRYPVHILSHIGIKWTCYEKQLCFNYCHGSKYLQWKTACFSKMTVYGYVPTLAHGQSGQKAEFSP